MDLLKDQPIDEVDEAALLEQSRAGDRSAFDELFRRHYRSGVRFAAGISSSLDPEDVTSEAFARIWSAISSGGGPEQALGPYLRTTIKNVATNLGTRSREAAAEDDHIDFWMRRETQVVDDGFSSAMAEHELVAEAFDTLPSRWKSVLWMIDVEGQRTSDVAKQIGMTPNSTTALTKRARSALGIAWLQAHVNTRSASDTECEWVLDHISRHTRRTLSPAQEERVSNHLKVCDSCERASHRIANLAMSLRIAAVIGGGSLAGMVAPVILEPTAAAAATTTPDAESTTMVASTAAVDGKKRPRLPKSAQAAIGAAAAAVVVAGTAFAVTSPSSPFNAAPQQSIGFPSDAGGSGQAGGPTEADQAVGENVLPGSEDESETDETVDGVDDESTDQTATSEDSDSSKATKPESTVAKRTTSPATANKSSVSKKPVARPTKRPTVKPTKKPTAKPTTTTTPTPPPTQSTETTQPSPTPTETTKPYSVIGARVTTSFSPAGAKVTEVIGGSPAQSAGLKVNDQITAINGQPVSSADELIAKIKAVEIGDEVKLTVVRDGETLPNPITVVTASSAG